MLMATPLHTQIIPEIPSSLLPAVSLKQENPRAKKKLVRRTDRDYSQLVRRTYQALFLLMNVWIGGVFYRSEERRVGKECRLWRSAHHANQKLLSGARRGSRGAPSPRARRVRCPTYWLR